MVSCDRRIRRATRRGVATGLVGLIVALGSGCRTAASGLAPSPVVPVGVGTPLQDSLDLVRAVARELTAAKYRRLVVLPAFVQMIGVAAIGITPSDSAKQRVVANAFAEALGAPVLKLPRGPDTARADSTVGTIGIVGLLVESHAGYVDLTFVPSARTMHREWMFTAYRYRYRREQGRWSFVRREWLGSA